MTAILIRRPFLSEGHLQPSTEERTRDAMAKCMSAAVAIDSILRLYRAHFCMKTCPFFISYATYVSGTIHARVAAQETPGSPAHRSLQNCLECLAQQQIMCHAPRRFMRSLLSLSRWLQLDIANSFQAAMPRTGPMEACHPIESADEHTDQGLQQVSHGSSTIVDVEDTLENLDLDAFLESFGRRSAATQESTAKQAPGSLEFNATDDTRVHREAEQLDATFDTTFLDTFDDDFNFAALDPLIGFEGFLDSASIIPSAKLGDS